ncbi:hypothetical protein AMTRI_Chr12g241300 [Amborella trichopoda]
MRFSSEQLITAKKNFGHMLGAGGCGAVYRVLKGSSNQQIEVQFMADLGTIGRIHHVNLYEFMEKGSLDGLLFRNTEKISFDMLHEIALGTAKGIGYLHEESQQRMVHYDIKPRNILLDENLSPKVADFGLAKLCNMDGRGRGTPDYAAPERWMPFPVTHKCDVYSYGMLLFEIVGRRRNLELNLESQEKFLKWVQEKFEEKEIDEIVKICEWEDNGEKVERMVKVALRCVQHRPEMRPSMSSVVKMLGGGVQIKNTTEESYKGSYVGNLKESVHSIYIFNYGKCIL